MQVTATELKNRLGQYLEAAQAEVVEVKKSGRLSTVLLSKKRYDALLKNEDMLWDIKAQMAEKEGFMSAEETKKLLQM
jgi:prevent-host-death family protein